MRLIQLLTGRCPDPQQWDVFLSGHLTEAADRALRSHLESCSSCQHRLKSTFPAHVDLHGLTTSNVFAREPECARLRQLALTIAVPDVGPVLEPDEAESGLFPLPPDYEYVGKIAEGGMGMVLKARQRRLQRLVAVKIVRPDRGSPDNLSRFQAEALKLAQLQHPNIVPVYDAGDVNGRPYFSMEYVDGGNLLTWIRAHLPAPRRAAVLVRDVALAIAYAHAMGIIHRDLKPGNILMSRNGEPKVTDFGLAKFLEGEQLISSPGMLAGTAPYMAPEQVRDLPGRVGPGVDVYGIGAILYELLAGRPPYHGSSRSETLRLVAKGELIPPSRERAGIPRDLETICLTCLRMNPSDRYPTAAEVAEDLQRFLSGEPIRSPRIGPAVRALRWGWRHRLFASLGLVAALGSLGGWEVRDYLRDAQSHNQRVNTISTAESDLDRGLRLCEQGRTVAGMLHMARAADALPVDEVVVRRVAQANLSAWTSQCSRLEDWYTHSSAITALALSDDGQVMLSGDSTGRIILKSSQHSAAPVVMFGHSSGITALAISEDGNRAVSGSIDGTARCWDLTTGTQMLTFEFDRPVQAVAITPDGTTAVFGTSGSEETLLARDLRTGAPVRVPHGPTGSVITMAVSGDGTWFAATGGGPTALVWRDPAEPRILATSAGRICGVSFHPDRQQIVTGGDAVRLWELRSGKLIAEWQPVGAIQVDRLSFIDEGRRLLIRTTGNELRVWDLVQKRLLPLALPRPEGARAFAAMPAGREFLVGSANGAVRRWTLPDARLEVMETEPGWHIHQLHVNPLTGIGVAVARPGTTAPTQNRLDCRAWVLDLQTDDGFVAAFLHPHAHPACVAKIDPSGRTVAVSYRNGDVLIWDAREARILHRLPPGPKQDVMVLAFEATGRWLLTASVDGSARVTDLQGGTPPIEVSHSAPIHSAAISAQGYFATGGPDGSVAVWQYPGGAPLPRLILGESVQMLAFTPDGQTLLALGKERGVRAWEIPSGKERGILGREAEVRGMTVAANGAVAVFGRDGVYLHGPDLGERSGTPFLPLAGAITSAAFDRTGSFLLAASNDQWARLICTETGRQIGPALPHAAPVRNAVWGTDEASVLTAAGNVVYRWKILGEPPPPASTTAWVRAWSGCELNPHGELVELSREDWLKLRLNPR